MKWRLVAALIATTLLVILVQDIPLSYYIQGVQRDRIITGLERDAFVLAGRSEEALESPTPESIAVITEVAKRSFTSLKKQEIFVIFYMAGGLAAANGGPFGGMIWNQYLRTDPAAVGFGIAENIPRWVAPLAGSDALAQRTFLHPDWLVPVGISLLLTVLGKLQ